MQEVQRNIIFSVFQFTSIYMFCLFSFAKVTLIALVILFRCILLAFRILLVYVLNISVSPLRSFHLLDPPMSHHATSYACAVNVNFNGKTIHWQQMEIAADGIGCTHCSEGTKLEQSDECGECSNRDVPHVLLVVSVDLGRATRDTRRMKSQDWRSPTSLMEFYWRVKITEYLGSYLAIQPSHPGTAVRQKHTYRNQPPNENAREW